MANKLSSTWQTLKGGARKSSPGTDSSDSSPGSQQQQQSASPPTSSLAPPSTSEDARFGRRSTPSASAMASRSQSPSRTSTGRPLAQLRVQILQARNLVAKDRGNTSDPFVVLNVPGTAPTTGSKRNYRRQTPVQSKQLNPVWRPEETTFELDVTADWFGGAWAAAPPSPALSTSALPAEGEAVSAAPSPLAAGIPSITPASSGDTEAVKSRPSNVRKISGAAGKILVAPVRIGAKGAVAGARGAVAGAKAVRRSTPRPLRLRMGNNASRPPRGSAALNPSGTQQSTVGALEFVVWDKDLLTQDDYMGEASLGVDQWISQGKGADWESSEPIWIPLVSTRKNSLVSGEIQVRVGFVAGTQGRQGLDDLYAQLITANRPGGAAGIRSVPADQSVGTAAAFIDDGLSSDSEEEMEELASEDDDEASDDEEGDTTDYTGTEGEDELYEAYYRSVVGPGSDVAPKGDSTAGGVVTSEPEEQELKDAGAVLPSGAGPAAPKRRLWKRRNRNGGSGEDSQGGLEVPLGSEAGETDLSASEEKPGAKPRRRRLRKNKDGTPKERRLRKPRRNRKGRDFALKIEQGIDIIGLVQMEVKSARDLPRWKSNLGAGFDMDAFCIAAFGTKIFRTRVVRHSLNPQWDEKLIFHVRRHESNFLVKLAVYDWDKLSSNDYVGGADLPIAELIEAAPKPDPETGLYAAADDMSREMRTFTLKLTRAERDEEVKFDTHQPQLTIQAKFTPYEALRQRFWRQLLTQYDTNDSGSLSNIELSSMLDTLGSTLSTQTIASFFSRFGKKQDVDELTFDEAVRALEDEIRKPRSEKRYASDGLETPSLASGLQTPSTLDPTFGAPNDPVGPDAPLAVNVDERPPIGDLKTPVADDPLVTPTVARAGGEGMARPIGKGPSVIEKDMSSLSLGVRSDRPLRKDSSTSTLDGASQDCEQLEQLIVLKSCPLCHMPRLSKKAEVDIVTHLAVCASQDWRRVDSMVVSNFVTASQAHRKWYTKMITKISQGQYRLGADSANIIVQDRATGELLEEKMQVYVRLGIRLMYRGMNSRMEGARIRRMLKDMSVKQGAKFDNPASAREIAPFIAFHNLNTEEILEPLDSFKTFNEFFYRKLKPGARPVEDPSDPTRLVSAADCRMTAYPSVDAATAIWIKGKEFSVGKLLGGAHRGGIEPWSQGSLCIFRLAPQDYHRFHSPVDAVVGEVTRIDGEYFTVNPMAVHSRLDIYGHNIRVVVPLETKEFGTIYYVCIGAMMVGSTILTVKPGQHIKRGDEIGYFAFGGSTIVTVFGQGRMQLDEDISNNSSKAIETLVKVGMGIGRATSPATAA